MDPINYTAEEVKVIERFFANVKPDDEYNQSIIIDDIKKYGSILIRVGLGYIANSIYAFGQRTIRSHMHNEKEVRKSLRDPLNVVFKHKLKIITVFLTVVVIVTIGSFLMPPVYEASSKILLKFGRENVFIPTTNRVEGRNPTVFFDSSRQERLNSEMEIIKGRDLIEKVISNLGVKKIYPNIDKEPLISLPFSKVKSNMDSDCGSMSDFGERMVLVRLKSGSSGADICWKLVMSPRRAGAKSR